MKRRKYTYFLPSGAGVCVKRCPSRTDYSAFICKYEHQAAADNSTATGFALTAQLDCMYEAATKPIGFYCVYRCADAVA